MDDIRIAAFVTFHYRPQTIQYFERVLRNYHDFTAPVHLTVVSNLTEADLAPLLRNYLPPNRFAVATFPDIQPGHMLCWMHKPLMQDAFAQDFTHFIYQEDDMDLREANFRYWLTYATPLRMRGLLPGLLCTEFHDGRIWSVSAAETTINPTVTGAMGQAFAAPRWPYTPCAIMDRAALAECLDSPAFDHDASAALCDWGPSERAANAFIWHRPPAPFAHRLVLPVDDNLRPLAYCQVPHMPNKYAPDPATEWGKTPVERVFS